MTKPDHPTPEVIWECKIGGPVPGEMPNGWDSPMRRAVQAAFLSLTGVDAEFTFSGRGQLTEGERAVVEKRAPTSPASGALPADIRALLEECQRWHNGSEWRNDKSTSRRKAWQAHRSAINAALASRESSSAPLTTIDEIMRIARLSEGAFTIQSDKDRRHLIGDVCDALSTILRRHSDTALASPQVAPTPEPIAHLKACGGLHAWMSYRTCSPDDPNAIPVYEAPAPAPVAPHPDDLAVDRFAVAMKEKLAAARAKGRGGWERPDCTREALSAMLREHVEKGDPRDVANFCMFLHQRGEGIAAPAPVAPTPAQPSEAQRKDMLMAARYLSADEGEGDVLSSTDACRIVHTLFDVGNLDDLVRSESANLPSEPEGESA